MQMRWGGTWAIRRCLANKDSARWERDGNGSGKGSLNRVLWRAPTMQNARSHRRLGANCPVTREAWQTELGVPPSDA